METIISIIMYMSIYITTHTRKGMETVIATNSSYSLNYNSHPQGDGNFSLFITPHILSYYNSHPQGDGNIEQNTSIQALFITTHTRKGMETIK